jgi:hypothetical protein
VPAPVRRGRGLPPRGKHQAGGVRDGLGNPEPFFHEGAALGEQAQLGLAPGKVGPSEHRRQDKLAETLVARRPVKGRHGLLEAFERPTIVALGQIGLAKVLVRQPLQEDISSGRGER